MNPYTFRSVFGVVQSSPLADSRSPSSLPSSCRAESYSVFANGSTVIVALARSEDVLFLCPNDDDPMIEGEFTAHRYIWPRDGKITNFSVACMTFSPCGRWLVCVLECGSIEVIAVSLVIPAIINSSSGRSSQQHSQYPFPANESSTIDLKIRDDCLGLPTCVLWYETRQKRPMLIYSNKGGDILFVDLVVRRLSASLQAPQSIHNLEIIEEAVHDDVYLLVSGFAGTQWLVPLEQGNMTLRETLARIVPSELKELNIRGSVSAVRSGGCNCIGVLHEDTFRLFNTTNFGTPVLDVVLPENTFSVRYTDLITFSVHKQIFATFSLNGCSISDYPSDTRREFTLQIGKLPPDCRFLGFAALPTSNKGALPSCLFVTETAVHFAESRWTIREYLANLLLADKNLQLIELYCQAVGLSFPASCFDAIPALLERKAIERALEICNLSKAPLYDIAKQFMERGFASFILPHLDAWLMDGANKASSNSSNEQAKQELSQLAFELHAETCKKSEGLERNKAEQRFKSFLLCNIWYDTDYCLKTLVKLKLYEHAHVVVKVHGLYEILAKELITMNDWDSNSDAFLSLATVPGLSRVLLDPDNSKSTYCHHYLSRVENLMTLNSSQRVRFLALFDPEREEMRTLLEIVKRLETKKAASPSRASLKSLLNSVVKFFISAFITYLYDEEEETPAASENNSHRLVRQQAKPGRKIDPIPLACGADHGCLIASDGRVYAFGRSRRAGGSLFSLPTPVQFPKLLPKSPSKCSKVMQVACGADHSLALMEDGTVYGWGSNKYGQLGIGRNVQSDKPSMIAFDRGGDKKNESLVIIIRIECGQYHSFALDRDGNAWGWGWNLHGQVGVDVAAAGRIRSRIEDVFRPTVVVTTGFNVGSGSGGEKAKAKVKAVACGYAHTIFLTERGRLYGCGNNAYGQLALGGDGDGDGAGAAKKATVPTRLKQVGLLVEDGRKNERFRLIACGYFHNIALSTAGRLFTWGATPQALKFKALLKKRKTKQNNQQQQQQSVDETCSSSSSADAVTGLVDSKQLLPTLIDLTAAGVNNPAKISDLYCGFHHCLLRTVADDDDDSNDGRLYSWGKNFEFQLGHGDKKERAAPTLISNLCCNQSIAYAACGADFTMAVDENGLVWAWGKNDSCQLGFESMTRDEKNSMAGRVLTIQRPNKGGQRTIQLPQDTRAYVAKPVRVAALRARWPVDIIGIGGIGIGGGGNEKEAARRLKDRFSRNKLISCLKSLNGYYDPKELETACRGRDRRYRCGEEIISFAYLVNGKIGLSFRILFDRLIDEDEEGNDRIDELFSFYADLISKCAEIAAAAEILTCIFDRVAFLNSKNYDPNEFVERNFHVWAPGIVRILGERPKLLAGLKPKLRLRAMEFVRENGSRKQMGMAKEEDAEIGGSADRYTTIDQDDIQQLSSIDRYFYKFPRCGHLVGQRRLRKLNDETAEMLIARKAPRIADLVQRYLENDDGAESDEKYYLPSDACPICLKQGLSRVFNCTTTTTSAQ